jgi:hypothetical protein
LKKLNTKQKKGLAEWFKVNALEFKLQYQKKKIEEIGVYPALNV